MALLHCCHRGCRLMKMQCGGQKQGTETKGLGGNGITEIREVPDFRETTESRLLLREKLVLLDVELFDFRVQRRAGNSKFRCRTFWARNFPFTFR
jgi:hypothetical protein